MVTLPNICWLNSVVFQFYAREPSVDRVLLPNHIAQDNSPSPDCGHFYGQPLALYRKE